MDRRSDTSVPSDRPARITTLETCPRELAGAIVNRSGAGLRLALDEPIPITTLLKIEDRDTVLLGEVCYCQRQASGYAVGLQLEHVLRHTEELARLAAKLRECSDLAADEAPSQVRLHPPERL